MNCQKISGNCKKEYGTKAVTNAWSIRLAIDSMRDAAMKVVHTRGKKGVGADGPAAMDGQILSKKAHPAVLMVKIVFPTLFYLLFC